MFNYPIFLELFIQSQVQQNQRFGTVLRETASCLTNGIKGLV